MATKLISIPIEEFNKLERIKALYEEALEVIRVFVKRECQEEYDWPQEEQNKAREFLEKVKI